MKHILAGLLAVMLSGCVTMPSFYDDNESLLAVDVRVAVSNIDCVQYDAQMAKVVSYNVQRFLYYTESKGSDDVAEMLIPFKDTLDGIVVKGSNVSETYCNIKKKILTKQSDDIATAVMGRY